MHKNILFFLTFFSALIAPNLILASENVKNEQIKDTRQIESDVLVFSFITAAVTSFSNEIYRQVRLELNRLDRTYYALSKKGKYTEVLLSDRRAAFRSMAFLNATRICSSLATIYYGYDYLEWRHRHIAEDYDRLALIRLEEYIAKIKSKSANPVP